MSNLAALRTATLNAADLLSTPTLGQIEKGFIADLIAVVGNPLLDISVTKLVTFVMKDGVVYKGQGYQA